jgi:four helix bundle protein
MNIVEGSVKSDRQFRSHCTSLGSAAELDYQFLLARDPTYVSEAIYPRWLPRSKKEQRMLVVSSEHATTIRRAAESSEGRWLMAEPV